MPDYDPKNIPVLDDVIESADGEKNNFDISAESPDDKAKENKLDLFTSETFDLAAVDTDTDIETAATETAIIEVETAAITDSILDIEYTIDPTAEPQIGSIDDLSDEDIKNVSLYKPAKASEDEAEKFETALIDYTAVDEAETSIIDTSSTNQQEEEPSLEVKQQISTAISLQSVTDDIVKQLMPELEQQLRLLLTQALKEKLPEDCKLTEIPSASNPDN